MDSVVTSEANQCGLNSMPIDRESIWTGLKACRVFFVGLPPMTRIISNVRNWVMDMGSKAVTRLLFPSVEGVIESSKIFRTFSKTLFLSADEVGTLYILVWLYAFVPLFLMFLLLWISFLLAQSVSLILLKCYMLSLITSWRSNISFELLKYIVPCLCHLIIISLELPIFFGSRAVVPNLFGTRDWFHGRQLFHRLGVGWEWFPDDSGTLNLLCSLFLI